MKGFLRLPQSATLAVEHLESRAAGPGVAVQFALNRKRA
jgi:hypothetical protein